MSCMPNIANTGPAVRTQVYLNGRLLIINGSRGPQRSVARRTRCFSQVYYYIASGCLSGGFTHDLNRSKPISLKNCHDAAGPPSLKEIRYLCAHQITAFKCLKVIICRSLRPFPRDKYWDKITSCSDLSCTALTATVPYSPTLSNFSLWLR